VSDQNNHIIRKIVIATKEVTTIAGTAGITGSADGTGAGARFYFPAGITTDGTYLYVSDQGNNTIRKIVITSGVVTTLAGTAGTSGAVEGTGPAARFQSPAGITTDGTNLYVADSINNSIRKIVIATGVVTTIANTARTPGSADGAGTAATFNLPKGITTDGTTLYVADTDNNTIRKIVIATGIVTTLAGTAGFDGAVDGVGTVARFSGPTDITLAGATLYVVDSNNQTIRKIQ
jgi:sugar lactone lactonase YvrE